MFFHVLSFSFIFFHFLSIFFHFLSFSFIFFHFLSFSFIFDHFLSFFLSLLGAPKSDFFGLHFVTISLDSSHVKNHFLGPSLVVPLWALFSFFSYFFFSPVFFCLFSSFLFFQFSSFFCSFLHFLISECFLFSFFIFAKEKVSSFLFSCISFKYFLLLAVVSEFNCFLRSRCSMEMWCPDDIGRDSWDLGLGRLLGGEHASTPQSGVEAPRLLKQSLPRLYYCCCCCCCDECTNV